MSRERKEGLRGRRRETPHATPRRAGGSRSLRRTLIGLALAALSAGPPAAHSAGPTAARGPNATLPGPRSLDTAPFGHPSTWDVAEGVIRARRHPRLRAAFDDDPRTILDAGDRANLGVEWDRARDIRAVLVLFAGDAPPPGSLAVQYWFSKWPNEGRGGWKTLDDPFHGRWLAARAKVSRDGPTTTWRFLPLSPEENPAIDPRRLADPSHASAPFRRTLKIRLLSRSGSLPRIAEFRTFGSATLERAALEVRWKSGPEDAAGRDGEIEVVNGRLLSLESLPPPHGVDIVPPCAWISPRVPGTYGIRIELLAGRDDDPGSADLGILRLRSRAARFSVLIPDVLREGSIAVRDLDVTVSDPRHAAGRKRGAPRPRTVRERILALEEQSLARAMREIPAKPPRPIPLGVPWARQEVDVGPAGDWLFRGTRRGSLRTPGRDLTRTPWDLAESIVAISTRPEPVFPPDETRRASRSLLDGVLPIVEIRWRTGGLAFFEEAFAMLLAADLDAEERRTGEETLLLCAVLRIQNPTARPLRADVWLRDSADRDLHLDPDGIVRIATPPPGPAPRGDLATVWLRVDAGEGSLRLEHRPLPRWGKARGAADAGTAPRPVLHWTGEIPAGETRRIAFLDPFTELLDPDERGRLRALDIDGEREKVAAFWRREVGRGMRIEIPDRLIQDFYTANLWHVRISTDRDPPTGLLIHGAATYAYPLFPNETCMVARALEMRGLHREAALYLEPMVHWQGSAPLPGNFRSREGCFYGAGPYTAQGYNMHHGFVLWALAEHHRWARDARHLARVADRIVRACRFIARERRATFRLDAGGRRVPAFGLAPAGDLEDVAEYRYWYATNGFFHLGLAEAARALAAIGHPDAAWIAREEALYREHIRASLARAIARAPVVRLRDGMYVPYVPPRVHGLLHRTEGWIRETLYPALHLATTGVLDPRAREVAWLLDDLEDNLLPSPESGFGIDFEEEWFSRGGIAHQPTLLDTPIVYLLRDEIPCYVRALYNAFAMSIHPDARCFCEWSRSFGHGGGPLYKTPDESKFVQWLRCGLVLEEGPRLWLAKGTPRAWLADGRRIRVRGAATFFGRLSFEIASRAGAGAIRARIEGPDRDAPEEIRLRLRHPRAARMARVEMDGIPWERFDPAGEWIAVPAETARRGVEITAHYAKTGDRPGQ